MSKVSIITAGEAAALVGDSMTVTTSGFVASDMPEALSKALEQRFLETGSPRDLTLFYAAAQGNRDGSGADHFAHEGMTKRVIGATGTWFRNWAAWCWKTRLRATTSRRERCLSYSVTSPPTVSAQSPTSV